jgi:hypothetical protein
MEKLKAEAVELSESPLGGALYIFINIYIYIHIYVYIYI